MDKAEIQKILLFIADVNKLPDVLLTEEDAGAFFSNDGLAQKSVYNKQALLFRKVTELKIRLMAYFRAVVGESSSYLGALTDITFKPKSFTYNTIHFENNKAWLNDKNRLLNLLIMAKVEFEEKVRLSQTTPERSLKYFLKSKEAKGIILTAILALLAAFIMKTHLWDKLFLKPEIVKSQNEQILKSIETDKQNVINKASKEFFNDYLETIKSLKKTYAPVSTLEYLQNYLGKEDTSVKLRISNHSYIHRFAINESLWTNTDFMETASLIKARTIDRAKEISEDVENKAQGGFIISDDKLQLLEEEVSAEVYQK